MDAIELPTGIDMRDPSIVQTINALVRDIRALQNMRIEVHHSPPTTGHLVVVGGQATLVLE